MTTYTRYSLHAYSTRVAQGEMSSKVIGTEHVRVAHLFVALSHSFLPLSHSFLPYYSTVNLKCRSASNRNLSIHRFKRVRFGLKLYGNSHYGRKHKCNDTVECYVRISASDGNTAGGGQHKSCWSRIPCVCCGTRCCGSVSYPTPFAEQLPR